MYTLERVIVCQYHGRLVVLLMASISIFFIPFSARYSLDPEESLDPISDDEYDQREQRSHSPTRFDLFESSDLIQDNSDRDRWQVLDDVEEAITPSLHVLEFVNSSPTVERLQEASRVGDSTDVGEIWEVLRHFGQTTETEE